MWFHNYHNFKDIRDRLGLNESFVPYNEVHFVFRDYEPETLKSEPPIYPLNLIQLLRRSPNLSLFSAFRQLGLLTDVIGYNHDTVFDKLDLETFELGEHTGLKDLYELIMQPAASVTLNNTELVSAAEMLQMMHLFFMSDPER